MGCDMWFGTKEYSTYIPTPVSGADVSPEAWGESGTTLNGSGFVMNSFNSHKTYDFSWRQSTARETAQLIKSFYDGSFGRGKLYLIDPLTTNTNILPARWADPSITVDFEGPQLVPGVDPRPVITSGFEKNKLPVTSAQFNLNGTRPVARTEFSLEAVNYFTNPRLVGSGSWAVVAENHFTNPDITGSGVWVEVSRNHVLNPGFVGASGVVVPEGFSVTDQGDGTLRIQKSPGATGEISIQAPGAVSTRARSQVLAVSGDPGTVYLSDGTPENRVPLNAQGGFYRSDINTSAWSSNTAIVVGSDMTEGSECVIGQPAVLTGAKVDYVFSGDSPEREIDPDMRQRWVGEVNNSASVMEGERPNSIIGTSSVPVVSQRSGKPAIRIISNSENSYAWANFTTPVAVRGGGTVRATREQGGILQNRPPLPRGLGSNAPFQSVTYENVTAPQALSLVYGARTGTYGTYFYHGGFRDEPDVWYTDIGLFSGEYSGPVFSGSDAQGSVDVDMRQRFTGAENNSTSVMEIETVLNLQQANAIAGVSRVDGVPAVRVIAIGSTTMSYVWFDVHQDVRSAGTLRATRHYFGPPRTGDDPAFSSVLAGSPMQSGPVQSTFPKQDLRLDYSGLSNTSPAAALGHGGVKGQPDVWYTNVGLYTPGYSGPWFSGSTQVPGKVTRWRSGGIVDRTYSEIGTMVPTGEPVLNDDNALYIPLPDGMQVNIGAFYESSSASAGVWVTPVFSRGVPAREIHRLTPLLTDSDQLFPDVFTKRPGVIGVYLWIGKTEDTAATVAVRGIHARLSPIGKTPSGVNHWVGGQGNAGVRFVGPPAYVNHTGVNGGQVECAASFKESLF